MSRSALFLGTLAAFLLAALPAAADLQDDPFWEEEGFQKEDYMTGTGTGGGPLMLYWSHDLGNVNEQLVVAGLQPLPDKDLYWGGAAWAGLSAGDKLFVGLGGGGFGGSAEAETGRDYARWENAGGYFSVKGIYPLHRRLYVEAGVSLGGGSSSVTVERTIGAGEEDAGIIEVWLRGQRNYLLLRPSAGIDLRIARWVGLLVEGGYCLTSGDWTLKGADSLLGNLDFGDGDGAFVSVMVRFGI